MTCRHGSIVTYAISDGDERMWACADCMLRFYPACRECVDVGHRNEKHIEPTLDEERLARALGPHPQDPELRARRAAAIAKAYREDTG